MTKTYQLALHLFRRDLRLVDNSTLSAALASSREVIPCFIFDDRQLHNNPYKSDALIHFMANSLAELNEALIKHHSKLYCFSGISEEVVAKLLANHPIDAVFLHRDYTPFSAKRDKAIEKVCEKNNIAFHTYADILLHEPEEVVKASDGKPYVVYTKAAMFARQYPIAKPERLTQTNFYHGTLKHEDVTTLTTLQADQPANLFLTGGRKEGLALLDNIHHLKDYQDKRNYPALAATTHLSAHNKFGTVSIREVYWQIAKDFGVQHPLINEIYWRDFFTHIGFHFPHVFNTAFQEKFQKIKWSTHQDDFAAWAEGRTGFPIVDAGMRELNTTGYMHNRVRMIVASFLCKDLHINWQEGEKYFAQHLIDYDAAVNNGNWQWAASTGCDAQPYFRIFNPWLQQEKFDADCLYIKRWIPELANYDNKTIHRWYLASPTKSYPAPMLDHKVASKLAIKLYSP